MIEFLRLLVFTLAGVFRSRRDLLLENFLLRQQLESLVDPGADPASAQGTDSSG